jgi:hypothetical protein
MTPSQILNAIGQHLLTMTDCPPVVWPNKQPATLPALPYLTVQMAARRTFDPTLDGSSETSTGKAVIVVVHDLNEYSTQADDLAALVKAHFPKGRLTDDLTIRQSQVLDGYPTDTDWRVPVNVDWVA